MNIKILPDYPGNPEIKIVAKISGAYSVIEIIAKT